MKNATLWKTTTRTPKPYLYDDALREFDDVQQTYDSTVVANTLNDKNPTQWSED